MQKIWVPSKLAILKDDLEDTKRSEDVYIVSKILSLKSSNNVWSKDLFSQLPFSHLQWNEEKLLESKIENEKKNIEEIKKKLFEYEKAWYAKSDQYFSEQFNNFFSQKYFLDIKDLETKISSAIGRQFKFRLNLFESKNNVIFNKLLIFYNFLCNSKIFSEQQLVTLLINIYEFDSIGNLINGEIEGYLAGDTEKSLVIQKMTLNPSWSERSRREVDFVNGFNVSPDNFMVFVHEFGHIIHNFYALNYEIRSKLNQNIPVDFEWNNIEDLDELFDLSQLNHKVRINIFNKIVVDGAHDYMVTKIQNFNDNSQGSDRNNDVYVKFARWISVPSLYGRTPRFENEKTREYFERYHVSLYVEWFAEGFAFWYLTPEKDRNKIWDFWHQLFTKELPKRFNN